MSNVIKHFNACKMISQILYRKLIAIFKNPMALIGMYLTINGFVAYQLVVQNKLTLYLHLQSDITSEYSKPLIEWFTVFLSLTFGSPVILILTLCILILPIVVICITVILIGRSINSLSELYKDLYSRASEQ